MTIEIDINDRTPPTPCRTEGCEHPRFHICFFGQEPEVQFKPEVFVREALRKKTRPSQAYRTPEEVEAIRRKSIGTAQSARWDKYRAETAGRDRKVVERYKQNVGMHDLQMEFNISRGKVLKILHEAKARGEVEIRPRNVTLKSKIKSGAA